MYVFFLEGGEAVVVCVGLVVSRGDVVVGDEEVPTIAKEWRA